MTVQDLIELLNREEPKSVLYDKASNEVEIQVEV